MEPPESIFLTRSATVHVRDKKKTKQQQQQQQTNYVATQCATNFSCNTYD
jgi:hypothetical protein